MHWKRILLLSLLGIVMGTASSFGVTRGQGFVLWIALACGATVFLAQKVRKSIFLHGFIAGFFAGVLDGATKGILISSYVASNPEVASDLSHIPSYVSAPWFLVMVGLAAGALYGGLLGFATWGAVKLIAGRELTPPAPPHRLPLSD